MVEVANDGAETKKVASGGRGPWIGGNESTGVTFSGGVAARQPTSSSFGVGPRRSLSAHALRHTACADTLRGGAELRDVQVAMGHATIDATELYMPFVVRGLHSAMSGRRYGTSKDDNGVRELTPGSTPGEQLRLPFMELPIGSVAW